MKDQTFSSIKRIRRIEWLGYEWEADDQIIIQALMADMRNKRPQGRPRTTWKDSIMKDLKTLKEGFQIDIACNKKKLKKIVKVALDLESPLSCI